jgi:hypothetical protein
MIHLQLYLDLEYYPNNAAMNAACSRNPLARLELIVKVRVRHREQNLTHMKTICVKRIWFAYTRIV